MQRETKTNVFVSYSRRDVEFALWLSQRLESADIEVFRDVDDTLPGEEWWKRLTELIGKADTVVFVLSPHSVTSKVCGEEVRYAVSLNKRIIPAVITEVDWSAAPEGLARIHSVIFKDLALREASLADLLAALMMDVGWVREHSRLWELASRWSQTRKSEMLLRGGELEAAEQWLTKQPKSASAPTNIHREFIKSGRDAARRRQRLFVVASLATTVLTAGAAVWALIERQSATEQLHETQKANTRLLAERSRIEAQRGNREFALALALEVLPADTSEENFHNAKESIAALDYAAYAYVEPQAFAQRFSSIQGIEFHPDSERLLITSDKVQVWDLASNAEKVALTLEGQSFNSASYSPNGKTILTRSSDANYRLWDGETGRLLSSLADRKGELTDAQFSPDGSRVLLYASGSPEPPRIWSSESGALTEVETRGGKVLSASFGPNGASFALVYGDRPPELLDARTGKLIARLDDNGAVVSTSAFSPSKGFIATGSIDGRVRLWEAETGKLLGRRNGHTAPVSSVLFDNEGRLLFSGSQDGTLRVWHNLESFGDELFENYAERRAPGREEHLPRDTDAIRFAKFTPDGRSLVTAISNGSAQLWNHSLWREADLYRRSMSAGTMSISNDGRNILALTDPKVLRVWDGRSGQLRAEYRLETEIRDAHISPNGKLLVIAPRSGQPLVVRLFQSTGDVVAFGKQALPRCFDLEERFEILNYPEPPRWCVELGKPPYTTGEWRDWLVGKRADMPIPSKFAD